MDYATLKKNARIFFPAFRIESLVSKRTRRRLSVFLLILLVVALIIILSEDIFDTAFIRLNGNTIEGFFILALDALVVLFMLESFYRSYAFRGLPIALPELGLSRKRPFVTVSTAEILFNTRERDVTRGLLGSPLGSRLFLRLGISARQRKDFLSSRQAITPSTSFSVETTKVPVSFKEYVRAVYKHDSALEAFLRERGIEEKTAGGAANWIERQEDEARIRERWWGRDRLARHEGIGKDWAYGRAFQLEKFSQDILVSAKFNETISDYHSREVSELEAILAREEEANALVIGSDSSGTLEVVRELAKKIKKGDTLAPLKGKRIRVLSAGVLIATLSTREIFEREVLKIFNEAVKAGNLILVIENFASFLKSADVLGTDVMNLIDPFLASPAMQVIAITDPENFHRVLETDTRIAQRFEKIQIAEGEAETILRLLEDRAQIHEVEEHVFFTYQTIETIRDSAERYFPSGVMPDKAIDLLVEIVSRAAQKKKPLIERSDILELVSSKTGIPAGKVEEPEKNKLLNLETILHKRIIGQDEAVRSISNAMRRARSGVGNPHRPMGSFLFLGPTGVGKTETTKALASAFFGEESAMVRLDMSEFSSADALAKLTGSFELGKPGVLVSALRDKPYGVLLLDEFEKTTSEVHDLFLQILDEGVFSDMSGRKVNVRNMIIIATSNAGSDLLWRLSHEGKNIVAEKPMIINQIINEKIFRPELLNRFDGVILFHPLGKQHLEKIARLLLDKLANRLLLQGLQLVITPDLLDFLVEKGTDPKFGARPLNRAIQEHVEQYIARKLIAGELKAGDKVVIDTKVFNEGRVSEIV